MAASRAAWSILLACALSASVVRCEWEVVEFNQTKCAGLLGILPRLPVLAVAALLIYVTDRRAFRRSVEEDSVLPSCFL